MIDKPSCTYYLYILALKIGYEDVNASKRRRESEGMRKKVGVN